MENKTKIVEIPTVSMTDLQCVHNIFVTIELLMHQENKKNYSFAIYPEQQDIASDAFYLAVATLFSTKGYKVALLDFDFQSDSLTKFLHCEQEAGIADYIAHNTLQAKELTFVTNSSSLYFMPNGQDVAQAINSFELSKSFKLEEELKEDFDIIIKKCSNSIDSPETSLIAKGSDSEILLVKENVSIKKRVNRMIENIDRGKRNLLGVVYFSN